MPTRAAVELSTHRDPLVAGETAARASLAAVGGRADLALVFATVGYAQAPLLAAVRNIVGNQCALVGCSGEGVIAGGQSIEGDHAVTVLTAAFDGTRVEAHLVGQYGPDPVGAAQVLADHIGSTDDVVGVLVFPDGLAGDCTKFLSALQARLPKVSVVGGTAGDAMTFERTYQYCNERVESAAVAVLVLRGAGRLKVSLSHGCTPVGPHQTITAVTGNWVETIDGRPAWDVFKEYLDGDPVDLNAEGIVHLCIGTAVDPTAKLVGEPMIIRTPLALNKQTGALQFPGGGLSVGQPIRMTRRDPVKIRNSAAACARQIHSTEPAPPAFVLQLDCAGRGKVMFGSCAAEEIIKPLRDEIGERVPWGGFHTYGEIAETNQRLGYHNYTVALCAFYDT